MNITSSANVFPINMLNFEDAKKNRTNMRQVHNLKGGEGVDDLLKTYIEKVDRDQASLREDIRESERRTEKRTLESEKRMNERLDRIEVLIHEQGDKIEGIKKDVKDGLDGNRNFMWGIAITIILSIITSIAAIIATYYSTISLLQNML